MEPPGESGETGHQASLRMATQPGFKQGIHLLGLSLQVLAFSRLVPVVDSTPSGYRPRTLFRAEE